MNIDYKDQVKQLIRAGCSNVEIAKKIGIPYQRVCRYIGLIYKETRVLSRMDIVTESTEIAMPNVLTEREEKIMELMHDAYTASDIANELGIKAETIRAYQSRIYKKLEVNSRFSAVSKTARKQVGE